MNPTLARTVKYAIACPGQGISTNGLLQAYKPFQHQFQQYLDELDSCLNCNFSQNLFANSDISHAQEWLRKTSNAQPAIFASTYIITHLLKLRGFDIVSNAQYLMGHSLGEYTALCLSGIVDFSTGVKIVRKRGELMEEIVNKDETKKYGMSALLINPNKFDEIIGSAQEWDVLANINSHFQIVIAGEEKQIAEFIEKCDRKLVRRGVKLPVSIPFHTSILKSMTEELAGAFGEGLNEQQKPIISNFTGEISTNAETTVENTIKANYQPVQWLKSMSLLRRENVTHVINLGPGTALHGINQKYDNITSISVDGLDDLRELTDFI
ncbi:Malonyl CoA-acyl carrier protein transacylase [Spathaspora sp. JA1]|nr:Malonyl CoA-acyl carrier protein transacylase [Spathaspora sp. JA1]